MCICDFFFEQSIENNVDLRYVTQRFLKTSESNYDPKSGEIEFALTVKEKAWEPSMEQEEWDPQSRTFTEVAMFYCILLSFLCAIF